MKRHASLRDLSVDHHHGLVHAQRLQKSDGLSDVERMRVALSFLEFWDAAISIHFRKEELALLPVFSRYGGDVAQPTIVEMLIQHTRIRGFVMELKDEVEQGRAPVMTLENIGVMLEIHIRLEEREVFPTIEGLLPEAAMVEIADRLRGDGYGERASRLTSQTLVKGPEGAGA